MSSNSQPDNPKRQFAFFGLVILCVLVVVLLPRRYAEVFFIGLILASLLYGIGAWVWWLRAQRPTWRARLAFVFRTPLKILTTPEPRSAPSLKLPAWTDRLLPLLIVAELAVVTWVGLTASKEFLPDNPNQTLSGGEVEWQVNTAYMAHDGLRDYGFIPLWNPYLDYGHPLIDNPQSFVLNPFSTAPSLLFGGVRGIKLGVVLAALLVGWGGWYLAYVIGLRTPGRLLLGALLIGKGNMLANFGTGYYQLATAQAYFPWIIGATLVILRSDGNTGLSAIQAAFTRFWRFWMGHSRLAAGEEVELNKANSLFPTQPRGAIVLLAVALTLQFWGGSIWYSLPMVLCIVVLALVYGFFLKGEPKNPLWRRIGVNWAGLEGLLFAGLLTVGLGAITMLPIWLQQDHMGGHPDDLRGGRAVELWRVVDQFFNGGIESYVDGRAPGPAQFYYSYIIPYWFLLIILVLVPPIWGRGKTTASWRLWLAALSLIVICTAWGAGGNPIITWMYRNLILLGQWRFVGRALGVSSFLIGVLVAVRVDGIFEWIVSNRWLEWFAPLRPMIIRATQVIFLVGMLMACVLACEQVIKQWYVWNGTLSVEQWKAEDECITWLRDQYPDQDLVVYRYGYQAVLTFVSNQVRLHEIEADFEPLPIKETYSLAVVTRPLPAFGIAWTDGERRVMRQFRYNVIPDSPRPVDRNHCLWHKEDVPPYAYSLSVQELVNTNNALKADQVTPATIQDFLPGRVRLEVQGIPDALSMVIAGELAYPGWQVKVDGERYPLESVGGLVGVILPKGGETHEVEFAYRPPLVYKGGIITLITAFFCILYLLRIDDRVKWLWLKLAYKPSK